MRVFSEKNFDKLSEAYDILFKKDIEAFAEAQKQSKTNHAEKNYTVFYPSFGVKKKDCKFLVYGQAVKGWKPNFNAFAELNRNGFSQKLLEESIEYSNAYHASQNHNPLDWINIYWSNASYNNFVKTEKDRQFYEPSDFRVHRSFFWNVIYKLICEHYDLDKNSFHWSSKLVWSNLYKIAPSERENPSPQEKELQQKISLELVRKELDEIQPAYCIVLTNRSWWLPFQKDLKTENIPFVKNSVIESVEKYGRTTIIVTSRPFAGNSADHAGKISEVLEAV